MPSKPLLAIVLAVSFVWPATLVLPPVRADQAVSFEERLLVPLPSDVEIERIGLLEDHQANLELGGFPFFSPDGKKVVYAGSRDGSMFVQNGDVKGKDYKLVRYLVASEDGKRVAYQAQKDGKWCVVVDGEEGPLFDQVFEVRFSPTLDRVAYRARQNRKWHVVLDGKIQEPYEGLSNLAFSPDGKHVSYVASKGNGMSFLVLDGKLGREYDFIMGRPIFSANSKRSAYVGKERGREFAVDGNQPKKRYRSVESLMFTPRKGELAYVATQGKNQFVVKGNQEYPKYPWVSSPYFHRKAKHARYAARSEDKLQILVGDKVLEEYETVGKEPSHFAWSPDGSTFAYVATTGDGEERVYQEGRGGRSFTKVFPNLQFGPRGNPLAYVAENDAQEVFVVVNGTVSIGYDDVYPRLTFSEDGTRVGYCARRGSEIWWKVVELPEPLREPGKKRKKGRGSK